MGVTICSHTICKNSQPFIDLVLRQAIPHVNRMFITISEKSTDGTIDVVRKIEKEFKDKVRLDFENVVTPGELTQVRQNQLNHTYEDWVWFLDDDDYWPTKSIEAVIELLNKEEDVDGYSFTPFQMVDQKHYDLSWTDKSFTKFFKYQDGVHYRHPWPRDLIYKGDSVLYWKKNKRVPRVPIRFLHLSNIKDSSFRDEEWADKFKKDYGALMEYPEEIMEEVWKIYDTKNPHR